jgi:hypothetical protein
MRIQSFEERVGCSKTSCGLTGSEIWSIEALSRKQQEKGNRGGEGREPKTGDEDSNYTRGITMSARFNHIMSNFLPTELAGISPLAVNHASPLNATS